MISREKIIIRRRYRENGTHIEARVFSGQLRAAVVNKRGQTVLVLPEKYSLIGAAAY